jgi:hypothetical protein
MEIEKQKAISNIKATNTRLCSIKKVAPVKRQLLKQGNHSLRNWNQPG